MQPVLVHGGTGGVGMVVLRLTLGLRCFGAALALLSFGVLWAADGNGLALIGCALMLYVAAYLNFYEIQYDGGYLTAPDWLLIPRRYDWADFEDIEAEGPIALSLRFAGQRVAVQKHLVGLPVLITFLSHIKALHRIR